ncbi:MAG: transcriptional repressor [Alphaproteobacteria bacterium]|nr:transcriptional repressor [Alphaproteobacteria bacterium]
MISQIEKLCLEKNIKLTENRKIIAKVISKSTDHPDVEEVYRRAQKINNNIGIATVYRTVKMFEEAGVITKHDFLNKGRARYEALENEDHHDHIVDITNDVVIEFFNEEIEKLKEKIAKQHGFELVGHKLELYCRPIAKLK